MTPYPSALMALLSAASRLAEASGCRLQFALVWGDVRKTKGARHVLP